MSSDMTTVAPFLAAGLDGTGQIVAVSDTGLDVNNCYFYDSVNPVPYYNPVGSAFGAATAFKTSTTHRKIAMYAAYVDNSDYLNGHGTHVCGSVLGHKSSSGTKSGESTGFADGQAKNARIAFFDIGSSTESLTVPGNVDDLFKPGYDAGARIHSASWGDATNTYSQQDADFDTFSYSHPDFLVFVAAGNDGETWYCSNDHTINPQLGTNCPGNAAGSQANWVYVPSVPKSVGSPANSKNVVTVGATENANNGIDTASGDKGYMYIAGFSSRGPVADGRRKPEILSPGAQVSVEQSPFFAGGLFFFLFSHFPSSSLSS